jgi:hypothetical protein
VNKRINVWFKKFQYIHNNCPFSRVAIIERSGLSPFGYDKKKYNPLWTESHHKKQKNVTFKIQLKGI